MIHTGCALLSLGLVGGGPELSVAAPPVSLITSAAHPSPEDQLPCHYLRFAMSRSLLVKTIKGEAFRVDVAEECMVSERQLHILSCGDISPHGGDEERHPPRPQNAPLQVVQSTAVYPAWLALVYS